MVHSFDVELAAKYGLVESILLSNFEYWIAKNQANNVNFHDGKYWTYNSIKAFQELFPYLTYKNIRTAIQHLIQEDVIITGNYNEKSYDRTLWYAFSDRYLAIFPNRQMDFTQTANAFAQNGKPIPNNKHNKPNNNNNIPYKEIIDYLNLKTGKDFKSKTITTQKLIKARWNEGFTLDDFKKVIDIKTKAWGNNSEMEVYLRPATLFGTKFEGYLNEGIRPQKQQSKISNEKDADELYKELMGE